MKNAETCTTLFLDRDGVINRQLPGDYVKSIDEFIFLAGATEALSILSNLFHRIILITNQRGIGRGLMDEEMLNEIHTYMLEKICLAGGRIDKIYFCPAVDDESPCRKPNIGMALQAKADFPDIDFSKSMMVGDSLIDIKFANNAGIQAILIGNKCTNEEIASLKIVACFPDLLTFARHIQSKSVV